MVVLVMKAKLICKCGHTKKDHMYPAENKWKDTYCRECGIDMSDLNVDLIPNCWVFEPDNLRMLENLSGKDPV